MPRLLVSRRAIASAIALAERGVEEQVGERTGAALEAAGVTARTRARQSRMPRPFPLIASAPRLMTPTREEVFDLIRTHLSEELGIDATTIEEASRFKEDLEADSLDLVELVVELEDRYGIRITEDEAERIKTVGQAVDFVLAQAPANPTS